MAKAQNGADKPAEAALEARLGYTFKNAALLTAALTHTSFVKGDAHTEHMHYERLEFLGDAVLELCASEAIYAAEPPLDEGEMTRTRAAMVCEAALAEAAQALGIGEHIRLGRGEENDGGREKPSILADVMEAILGAAYLDGSWDAAGAIFERMLPRLGQERAEQPEQRDHKTVLQELLHKLHKPPVMYKLVESSGPDHAKHFVVQAVIEGRAWGRGEGHNKKSAEQQAAKEVLDNPQSPYGMRS